MAKPRQNSLANWATDVYRNVQNISNLDATHKTLRHHRFLVPLRIATPLKRDTDDRDRTVTMTDDGTFQWLTGGAAYSVVTS